MMNIQHKSNSYTCICVYRVNSWHKEEYDFSNQTKKNSSFQIHKELTYFVTSELIINFCIS